MGLEVVMICIDNSEHSRNGDYAPSRFDAQSDTANIVGELFLSCGYVIVIALPTLEIYTVYEI